MFPFPSRIWGTRKSEELLVSNEKSETIKIERTETIKQMDKKLMNKEEKKQRRQRQRHR